MLAHTGGSLCRAPTAALAPLVRVPGMGGLWVQSHLALLVVHHCSGIKCSLSRDTASKVCGEQMAAPLQVRSVLPLPALGVLRDLWSRQWHTALGQRSDPGWHRPELQTQQCSPPALPACGPTPPSTQEIYLQVPHSLQILSSC